jgi:hypothetical protein
MLRCRCVISAHHRRQSLSANVLCELVATFEERLTWTGPPHHGMVHPPEVSCTPKAPARDTGRGAGALVWHGCTLRHAGMPAGRGGSWRIKVDTLRGRSGTLC